MLLLIFSMLSLNWKVIFIFCWFADSHSNKSTDGWSLWHFNRKWRWVCHFVADYNRLRSFVNSKYKSMYRCLFSHLIIMSVCVEAENVRLILATFPRIPFSSADCGNSLASATVQYTAVQKFTVSKISFLKESNTVVHVSWTWCSRNVNKSINFLISILE